MSHALPLSQSRREPAVWWTLTGAFFFMFTLVLAANLFSDMVRDAFRWAKAADLQTRGFFIFGMPKDTEAERALRAEAIVRNLEPTRIVYHHSSGNMGSMPIIVIGIIVMVVKIPTAHIINITVIIVIESIPGNLIPISPDVSIQIRMIPKTTSMARLIQLDES